MAGVVGEIECSDGRCKKAAVLVYSSHGFPRPYSPAPGAISQQRIPDHLLLNL